MPKCSVKAAEQSQEAVRRALARALLGRLAVTLWALASLRFCLAAFLSSTYSQKKQQVFSEEEAVIPGEHNQIYRYEEQAGKK